MAVRVAGEEAAAQNAVACDGPSIRFRGSRIQPSTCDRRASLGPDEQRGDRHAAGRLVPSGSLRADGDHGPQAMFGMLWSTAFSTAPTHPAPVLYNVKHEGVAPAGGAHALSIAAAAFASAPFTGSLMQAWVAGSDAGGVQLPFAIAPLI